MKKIILCTFLAFSTLFSTEYYKYEEQTGNNKSYFTWVLEEGEKSIKIVADEDASITTLHFTKNFVMYRYAFKSKIEPTEYVFSLNKNILQANGKVNNLEISKEYPLKTRWIQQFGFGLRPFVLSEKKLMEFSLLTIDKFELQKMVATKEGKELVSSNGKTYDTIKVSLSLTGFKKMFWKARLWFDSETGVLVKYSANKGPNTATTTIMLQSVEKKEGSSDKVEKSSEVEVEDKK